jgi:LRR receptor-like serine/threonine-protein kinase FLS2
MLHFHYYKSRLKTPTVISTPLPFFHKHSLLEHSHNDANRMANHSLLLLSFLSVQSCMFQLAQSSTTSFTDQSALIAFNSKISSCPNETVLAGNWSTTTSFCNGIGVSCSRRRQRVTALNLSYMGLRGTISPHIGNLSFLIYLNLRNNSFFDSLTHAISHLHRLRILRLSSNLLEGNIPPTLHNCPKLRRIDLSTNNLVGSIPSTIGNMSSLELLNLEYNSLTGPFPRHL